MSSVKNQSTRRNSSRTLVAIVALLGLILVRPVYADVGPPPWAIAGSSVGPDEAPTQVQMVSEDVLIVVESNRRDDILSIYESSIAANLMLGHVDATFRMRNQGDETESFDVWFPMWTPDMYADADVDENFARWVDIASGTYGTEIENFAAWVGGVPAEVRYLQAEGQKDTPISWATWFVSFPPGQDVEIRVTYDLFPSDDGPFGTFHYILETGADWWGPIGAGTITLRLPYAVNESNTALDPDSRNFFGPTAPKPGYYTASGTDVVWRFTDLEPTADDNVRLTVMVPAIWDEIATARQEADANPDSAQAQIRLAHALVDGLEAFKATILPQANSVALADAAKEAFQRALDLSPESAQVSDLVRYLELLYWMSECDVSALPDDTLIMLEQALERNPDEVEPVVGYLTMLFDMWVRMNYDDWENAPPPSDALLSVLKKTAEIAPDRAEWVLDDWKRYLSGEPMTDFALVPGASPTPSPEPTLLSTSIPIPTATPVPTPQPTSATASEQDSGRSSCVGAMALVAVPLCAVWVLRKRNE